MKSPVLIKTVFDVKVFSVLRNLYVNGQVIDPEDSLWQKAYLNQERDGLLEQTVVNQYVKDNRINIEVSALEIKDAKKILFRSIPSKDDRKKIFSVWNIKVRDVDSWIEERLILEKFLQSHPPFQAIITDRKIEQYYLSHQGGRFLNQPLAEVREVVEKDYQKMHLQVEFKKWMDQEIRRQKWEIHD